MDLRGTVQEKGRVALHQPLTLGQCTRPGLYLNLVAELRSTFLGSCKCFSKFVFCVAAMVLFTVLMFLYVLPMVPVARPETQFEALLADAKDLETFQVGAKNPSATLALPEPARDLQHDASNSKSGNLLTAVDQDDMFTAYGLGLPQVTASRVNGSEKPSMEPKRSSDPLIAHRHANEDELHNSSRAEFNIEDYLQMPRALLNNTLISDQLEPTFARIRYSLGGDRPSQTTHHTLS